MKLIIDRKNGAKMKRKSRLSLGINGCGRGRSTGVFLLGLSTVAFALLWVNKIIGGHKQTLGWGCITSVSVLKGNFVSIQPWGDVVHYSMII